MRRSLLTTVRRVVQAGQIGRTRSFVVALGIAALLLPTAEALAYFSATGTGTFASVQAASASPSTVSIVQTAASPYVYKDSAGAVVAALPLGGQLLIPVDVTCTAGAPCQFGTIAIQSWTSNKAGCDSTTLPGSFTGAAGPIFTNATIATVGAKVSTNYSVVWNNLSSTNQNACLGAKFTFVLAAA
jgi:hypothetical protein